MVLKTLLFLIIVLGLNAVFSKPVFATLSACSASIDTSSVEINSTTNIIFTINNEDNAEGWMRWVKVTVPSSNFNIDGYGSSQSYSGFSSSTSSPQTEGATVTVGSTAASSANWTVEASDDEGGANAITCSGSLGMSIIDPASLIGPTISNVTISNLSSSSMTISWTTDKDTNSEIDYGESSAYGLVKSDPSMTTSHSLSLDSLSANTTYHYTVKSTDGNGNSVNIGDQLFTTSSPGSETVSTPQTVTVTNTKTVTITPTPVPTPVPDTTPPAIYLITDFSKSFSQSPEITGTVKDNKAVSRIEYSLDNGENFLPVDSLENPGRASTAFSFMPSSLDDGNYELKIRAKDSSGNIGYSKAFILVIDRIPPQVSGVMFSLGPQILTSRQDGSILVGKEQKFKITLSDVGGAISIDIFVDNLKNESEKYSLIKNPDSGLWSTNLVLAEEGEHSLRFSAIDGAGNKTENKLNKIVVVENGKINVGNANVAVYFFDKTIASWRLWDGAPYGQKNPVKSDKNGNYNLFLPAGKYYLQIDGWGFQTLNSEFFTLTEPTPINANFSLQPLKLLLDLKIIKLYWPDFSTLTVVFNNNLPKLLDSSNQIIGKKVPFFSLTDGFKSDSLNGKPSILTFLNTWAPFSTEQISIINSFSQNKNFNSATIVLGEKSSKVYVFKKRGSYNLPMYADPDATLVTTYNLNVLPTSYFIDRKGIVKKVISGVLSEQEIIDILSEE